MYAEDNCNFDPNTIPDAAAPVDGFSPHMNGFSTADESLKHSAEELAYLHHHQEDAVAAAALDIEFQQQQQQLAFGMESAYNNSSGNVDINNTTGQLVSFDPHHPNWHHQQQQQQQLPEQPDLLNLFHFPRCSPSASSSLLPTSTITFANSPSSCSSVLYDPLLHLNLPPQPPIFKELFQSLPNGYNTFPSASRNNINGSLFGAIGDIEREGSAGIYGQDGPEGLQFENGVLEFARDRARIDRGRDGRGAKHFVNSERHRRDQMRDTYSTLRSLVPNPTKNDRASVVGDAIEYIQELRRTVNELKLLVEKKRRGRESNKRQKTEEDTAGDVENCHIKMEPDQSYIRSSWLQRKSKDTEVDVRIIDDEVTVKLVQRKKINLLLTASRVLDELQLDLRHVAGGHVGDTYSFLFNTKICEGSSLYASAIASKLIDVLDRQYAAILPPTSSY